MSDIDLHLEIPKTITLAPVALRVQSSPYDDLFFESTNEFAAVGGVLVIVLGLLRCLDLTGVLKTLYWCTGTTVAASLALQQKLAHPSTHPSIHPPLPPTPPSLSLSLSHAHTQNGGVAPAFQSFGRPTRSGTAYHAPRGLKCSATLGVGCRSACSSPSMQECQELDSSAGQ